MADRVKAKDKPFEIKSEKSVSSSREADFSQSHHSPEEHTLFLQGMFGNQEVQKLFKDGMIQAKLRIDQPGDKYEQKADRIADIVMRMPETHKKEQTDVSGHINDIRIQRICPECEEGSLRHIIEKEEKEIVFQARAFTGRTPGITADMESRIHSMVSGQPLPESVSAFFGKRFGYDFSHVRIHNNSQANEIAQAVKAHAFTIGHDIIFGSVPQFP